MSANEQLKDWLRGRGIKQIWLAEQLGVHVNMVSRWCLGKSTPSLAYALEIQNLTGIGAVEWVK